MYKSCNRSEKFNEFLDEKTSYKWRYKMGCLKAIVGLITGLVGLVVGIVGLVLGLAGGIVGLVVGAVILLVILIPIGILVAIF
jgi:uncharacterized membrane protein YkgB